jgi:hypothetical protein
MFYNETGHLILLIIKLYCKKHRFDYFHLASNSDSKIKIKCDVISHISSVTSLVCFYLPFNSGSSIEKM